MTAVAVAAALVGAFPALPGVTPLVAQPVFVTTWGERGEAPGEFQSPAGMAARSADTLFVVDTLLERVTLFDSQGELLSLWGTPGSAPGELRLPVGLAADATGHVYIADSGNHRVQRFRDDGTFVEAFGDSGAGDGQFQSPSGLHLTPDGQLYVADNGNRRIQHIDWSRSPPRFVRALDGGLPGLAGPTDVVVDTEGFVYIADFDGLEIVKLDASGRLVRRWSLGAAAEPSAAPLALMLLDGMLHASDPLNGRVRVYDRDGNFVLSWPSGGVPAPTRMTHGPTRRVFVASGDLRIVFVYQAPVGVQRRSWGDVKSRYRRMR